MNYDIVAQTQESTIVSEYKSTLSRNTTYQSEAELEKEFINILKNQAYEYLNISSETDLIANLRKQLGLLNDYAFSW